MSQRDSTAPTSDQPAPSRGRVLRKWLYQRFWGGRGRSETPLVLFVAGDTDLADGRVLSLLENSLETQVYRFGDTRAFDGETLHADQTLRTLVGRSHAPVVVFELGETHSGPELGSLIERFHPARALWLYADYRRAVRRALEQGNPRRGRIRLDHLANAMADWPVDAPSWPAALVSLAHDESLDPASTWALLWYARHAVLRDSGLYRERSLYVYGGEAMQLTPRETAASMFEAAGLDTRVLDSVDFASVARRDNGRAADLSPELDTACDGMQVWLDRHARR